MNDSCPAAFGMQLPLLLLATTIAAPAPAEDTPPPFGLESRTPWTTSRLIGSPEPPAPYLAAPVFDAMEWDRPIYMEREPGTEQLLVILQGGEKDKPTRLVRLPDRNDATETSVLLEVPDRVVYGMTFHPNYHQNGYLYLFSNGPTGQPERTNQITRYTVARESEADPPCDPESAKVIIEWRSMGHDGGDLVFGHDGMLYATTGDGTGDSDQWLSAQDPTNLLGGVIRIDVDHPGDGMAYSIPPDNPFLDVPNARGELWAIGLRNPWRMSIDDQTGQIWVGNNGQDLWETAHLLGRGENYGWSVYEGSHPFYAGRELGPGKLVDPTFEHHHIEARSLTGGIVYYGDQLPELRGAYVYGDFSTGKIWAGRHDGQRVTFHQEIADTTLQITAFSNSHRGELLVLDHAGGIFRLSPNPAAADPTSQPEFPLRLSDTGLFTSVADHTMAAGVIAYDVNTPAWNDGATAQRWLAIPDDLQVSFTAKNGWNFPDRSVLVQTLNLPDTSATQSRRIETRLLVKHQGEWTGYSYHWNDAQTEAHLVESSGADLELNVPMPDGSVDKQMWRIPARSECMSCHARAVNYVLGLSDVQMNRSHDYGSVTDNQIRTLTHIGLLTGAPEEPGSERSHLASLDDKTAPLAERVKSYLHTNCSCCHVTAGGGNAKMKLDYATPLEDMEILSQFPQHATFGLAQPQIISPGKPEMSVMLTRLSRRGRGQMPPLVTQHVDTQAVALFQEWVSELKSDRQFVRNWSMDDFGTNSLQATSESEGSLERGKELYRSSGCGQCHRIEDEIAGVGPNLTNIWKQRTPREVLESILAPSAKIDPKYATTIVVTMDGKVLQGRVESETDQMLVLRSSESFAKTISIAKSDIEERQLSQTSRMPAGVVNHLQREEILDLLQYVATARQ